MPVTRAAVSVIVPVYNVAPYLGPCIASLFDQTVPLDIIVVNDGSTDDTARLLRELTPPPRHSFVVIDQPNRGLGAARNAGLRLARADFVGFVDGDDWIDSDMYAALTTEATRHEADLVICGGQMVHHETRAAKPFTDATRLGRLAAQYGMPIDPRLVPDVFLLDASACKRLYRRAALQRIGFEFPEGILFEDSPVHYQLLLSLSRVLLVDRAFYFYRIGHPGRITDRKDDAVLTVIDVMRRIQSILKTANATVAIWARFVWFQQWVLRWLCSQVDDAYTEAFFRGVMRTARAIPRPGILEFQREFADDQTAQQAVALQLLGWKTPYVQMARGAMRDRDKRLCALAGRLQALAARLGSAT